MWQAAVISVVIVPLLVAGCTEKGGQSESQEELAAAISPGGTPTAIVSSEARREFSSQALQGDGAAAWELAVHYGNDNDANGYDYWSRIAIENRQPQALISVGYNMTSSESYCAALRGHFLLSLGLSLLPPEASSPYWQLELDKARERLAAMPEADCSAPK